ncbi:MAG: hypothetical protein KJ048_00510 [Dehalococcoidia bacterium]|nr:hypothetical protein [Dehalococcoidia bacterium]
MRDAAPVERRVALRAASTCVAMLAHPPVISQSGHRLLEISRGRDMLPGGSAFVVAPGIEELLFRGMLFDALTVFGAA